MQITKKSLILNYLKQQRGQLLYTAIKRLLFNIKILAKTHHSNMQ